MLTSFVLVTSKLLIYIGILLFLNTEFFVLTTNANFTIPNSYWIGETKPCLTYGLRGLAAFSVSVQCCEQDLHSGVMGGSVHEVRAYALYSSRIDRCDEV